MPRCGCRRPCGATRMSCAARRAWRCRSASASTPATSWCARSAAISAWTTPPWARPRTWRPAWSSSRRLAASGSPPRRCTWPRASSRSPRSARCRSRGSASRSRCSSWWGQAPPAPASRPRRGGGSRASSAATAELEQLRGALDRASLGHGQVVAVVGEPGVGKSRLFWELTHSHRVHGWLIVEAGSVSYGKATAYLPVIELLRGYFAIDSRDDPRKIREKVTGKVLTLGPALGHAVPAFLALLDVPVEEASWHALDPLQRRQQTLDAVKRLLLRESEVQPLIVVFEDLHWIDGETQSLLDSLVESLPAARLAAPRQLPPRVPPRLGRQDLLPPAPDRSPAARERRRAARGAPRPGRGPRPAQAAPDRADGSQSPLPRGECAGPGGDGGPGRRARRLPAHPARRAPEDPRHRAGHPGRAHRPPGARGQATAPGRRRHRQGRAHAAAPGHCRRAGARGARRADAPPGRGVPLRDPALPGPRVHVQARAHARGGVPGAAPRPAARPARPHHRGHRAALHRARRRADRTAGASRRSRGAVGEGGRLSPPGGAPGHGAGR